MRLPLTLILCVLSTILMAQHLEDKADQSSADHVTHDSEHAHHMVQILIGHTHIPDGRNQDGEKESLILPSWGLNYNYKFDESWQIGIHTDMIIDKFEIELEHDMIIVERSRPIALAIVGGYKTRSPFTFLLGGGIEFETHKNLGFIRLGVEPGWHFGEGKWEVSVFAEYEIKINHYNSWSLGLGIARLF